MKSTFLFFTGEEWTNFSQRTQSLAIELAERGHRVYFFEPMLSVGKCVRYLYAGKTLRLPHMPHPNITLLRPFLSLSTFRGSLTQPVDKFLFGLWFRSIKKRYGIAEEALVYINLPYWWSNIIDRRTVPSSQLIFDCLDDCAIFSRNERVLEIMENAERQLAKDATVVFATAQELAEKLEPLNSKVRVLSNGVDTKRFIKSEYSIPSDLTGFAHPVMGFVGALFHWIDFGVFEELARSYPQASIVLVGPTNRPNDLHDLVKQFPNIIYLGPRPYSDIPDYLHAFDICLNPFKMDQIGDTVNPLKLYEYLSLGKPVISARTKEMTKFSEYIYLYENYESLREVAQTAIDEDDEPLVARRVMFAKGNSWEKKVDYLLETVSGAHP